MAAIESKSALDDDRTANIIAVDGAARHSLVPWPSEEDRFLIDLEFVQNLCNIEYLHFLAQNKYFDDSAFINYLKYLRYWRAPEYITFLAFPQCLDFLDALISSPRFRKELNVPQFVSYCHEQQGLQWMYDSGTDCK